MDDAAEDKERRELLGEAGHTGSSSFGRTLRLKPWLVTGAGAVIFSKTLFTSPFTCITSASKEPSSLPKLFSSDGNISGDVLLYRQI